MKWLTKQSVHIGFAALAMLIAFLGSLFYFQANNITITGHLIVDSYEVMDRIEVLFRQFKDAKTSVFDYVITGDASDRDHYRALMEPHVRSGKETYVDASIEENLQQLLKLTISKPEQQRQIDQLELLLQAEHGFLDQVVVLREQQGFQGALKFIKAGGDELIIIRINQTLLSLQAEAKKLLEQRIAEDNYADLQNTRIILAALLVALSVITLAYLLIMRNLKRRLSAEENLLTANRWQQAILNGSPYAIIATNEKGIIHIYNPAAGRMLGYTAAEIIGKETPALFNDQEELDKRTVELSQKMERSIGQGFETLIAKVSPERVDERECAFIRKDGLQLPVFSSVTMLMDTQGVIIGYLFIVKDITEQKRMERMKNEFISTVSHELRTPLTSIRGALGLIVGGAAGELPVKVKALASIAHKNSERLVRIVNDILDVEKIKSGKMQLLMQQIDLSVLVREAIEANQAYAEKHHVRLVLEHAPEYAYLMADSDRLMQVMANLLSNAAKFSPEGSQVGIRIDHFKNTLRVSVQDHGPGIPEEFRNRIFEKFAQADTSAARAHEGTGLGLSITRQLAEAMGGTVGFTTEPGKGSIFYVELPALAQKEAVPPTEPTAAEHQKDRVLVLIVEDNHDIASLLKMMLEQAGFVVDIAYTLAQARIKLRTQSYAAMTLDLTLPDGDGITLIREVRSQPAIHNLPIVVVSGTAEKNKGNLGGEAVGLIDWLVKPIDQSRLVEALRRAVSHDSECLPRILHVEDDPDISIILREMLKDKAEVVTAATLKEARALLDSQNFALVVLDLSLPDGSGIDLLKYINTLAAKSPPVLILSASEASADIRIRVAGALVKSRTSETRIINTILSLIHNASGSKEAA